VTGGNLTGSGPPAASVILPGASRNPAGFRRAATPSGADHPPAVAL